MANTTTKPLRVILFLGTTKENRLGLRVAKFMQKQLEATNHKVDFLDAMEMDIPMLHKPVFFYKDRTSAPEWLVEAERKIKEADAYVVVSGEYNHSIPPGLANMMDHFGGSCYGYKPSGIVCYSPGIYGGMRAAIQLRSFLGELGCLSVSNIFGIPKAHEAFDEEGVPKNDHMVSGATRLITQLDWHAHAMRNHRESVGVPK